MTNREIDYEIAEKVMGWTDRVIKTETCYPEFDVTATPPNWGEYGARYHRVPDFSTDLTDAMQVQAEMERRGFWLKLTSPWEPKRGGSFASWNAGFTEHGFTGWNGGADHKGKGETPALAICLAALKAVGVEVTEARG